MVSNFQGIEYHDIIIVFILEKHGTVFVKNTLKITNRVIKLHKDYWIINSSHLCKTCIFLISFLQRFTILLFSHLH